MEEGRGNGITGEGCVGKLFFFILAEKGACNRRIFFCGYREFDDGEEVVLDWRPFNVE